MFTQMPPRFIVDQGVCASLPVEQADRFFPEKGQPAEPARKICRTCPVREQCEEWAMSTNQEHGVWGATSPEERKAKRKAFLSRD